MKRIGLLLALAVVSACTTGDVTGPGTVSAKHQTALLSITALEPAVDFGSAIFYGRNQVDSAEFSLGLENHLGFEYFPQAILLEDGETVNLAAALGSTSGLSSDGKVSPIYKFITSWHPVNPAAH